MPRIDPQFLAPDPETDFGAADRELRGHYRDQWPETPEGLRQVPPQALPETGTPDFYPHSPEKIAEPGPASSIPLGPVQGQPFLLPQYNDLGKSRPLGPREYIRLKNGGWASEMTYTLPLNGQWAVVPGLWVIDGVPMRVDEDQAAALAQQSGLVWRTFPDEGAADAFSGQREKAWQAIPFGRSDMQQPLWSRRWPPP